MKRFNVVRKVRNLYLFSLLFILAIIGGFFYLFFILNSDIFGITNLLDNSPSPFSFLPALACSFPISLFILFAIWMGLLWLALQRACLIFEDVTLRQEANSRLSFLFFQRGFKPFSIDYDQIKIIRNGRMRGSLQILDREGRAVDLIPSLFGNNYGEEILLELQKHVTKEQFESGMEIPSVLKKWQARSKKFAMVQFIFLALYLATLSVDSLFSTRSWFISTWKVEVPMLGFGYNPVRAYSPDTQSTFWIVNRMSFGYRSYHFPDKSKQFWDLPTKLVGQSYPQLASGDKNGNPIIWMESGVFHYNHGTWETIPYADGLKLGDWNSRGIVSGEYAWAIEKDSLLLLKIDALTGNWSQVPLPPSAIQQNLSPQSIRRAANGETLILMQNGTSARVYRFIDEQWQAQEYLVILPDEQSRVWDYFLGVDGTLWTLIESQDKAFVEKMSTGGQFQVTKLPQSQLDDEFISYRQLIVDSNERLWVSGDYPYFMAVLLPTWQGEAREIEFYTEKNSNFQGYKSSFLSPDGKIFTFNQMITSIDTRLETLPSPLPDWFANINWGLVRAALSLLQVILSIGLLIVILMWAYPQRTKQPKNH